MNEQENKLKEVLDGSMWNANRKPPTPSDFADSSFRDELIQRQHKIPIKKIIEMVNVSIRGDKMLVEPSRTVEKTASGLFINISKDNTQDLGYLVDTCLMVNRVICISEEQEEKFDIHPGDLVILGPENTAKYKIYGILVEETRVYNISGKIIDVDFHDAYSKWVGGNVDITVPNEKTRDDIEEPKEGMLVRVASTNANSIYRDGRWEPAPTGKPETEKIKPQPKKKQSKKERKLTNTKTNGQG